MVLIFVDTNGAPHLVNMNQLAHIGKVVTDILMFALWHLLVVE